MALVTLSEARKHVKVSDTDDDAELASKLAQAEAIITVYLKSQADSTWNETTTPRPVQAAVLLMLGHLYEHRGDDMGGDEALWAAVGRLLVMYRDPALT